MHGLFIAADCSQNIIRVLFVDFSKAFDVIAHNVLFTSDNRGGICDCPQCLSVCKITQKRVRGFG